MLLALTGMMGSGKSTVGALVADALGCPFVDLDEEITRREGRSIPEIFASEGEEAFRKVEERTLRDLLRRYGGPPDDAPRAVLSLGGGTVSTPGVAALVREKTLCIYLEASLETLLSRLEGQTGERPMASEDLPALLAAREPLYRQAAHITLPADGLTPEELTDEIIISCL